MIRDPEPDDADDLGRIHVRAWQAAYRGGLVPDSYLDQLKPEERSAVWASALAAPPRPLVARFVCEVNDSVAGFIVVGPEITGSAEAGRAQDRTPGVETADLGRVGRGQVYVINVDPDHWGTGVGADLFAAGVAALTSAGFEAAVLWVHPGNTRARAFYERRGWVADGATQHELIDGVEVPEVRYIAPLTT